MNLSNPSITFWKLSFLLFSWSSIVSYLTIGPAISCGKKDMYKAKLKKFF